MIDLMNAAGRPVVAVDVPSGVNASTGEVPGAAVRATTTMTFGAAKVGLAIAPGLFHAGSVHIAPIGLRPRDHEHALVPASALLEVPRKRRDSTKYTAGSVLVIGGSRGLTGAPMLTARAAFRADAGLAAQPGLHPCKLLQLFLGGRVGMIRHIIRDPHKAIEGQNRRPQLRANQAGGDGEVFIPMAFARCEIANACHIGLVMCRPPWPGCAPSTSRRGRARLPGRTAR